MGWLRETFLGRDLDDPVDGTNVTLWPQVQTFYDELTERSGIYISPSMAERIWVVERCIQLNAQQIGAMPVRFHSTAPGGGFEPAWVASPDPVWFPNGIGDALFAIVKALYGRGHAELLITSRYFNGFPSAWTVLDADTVTIRAENGRRRYKVNGDEVDPADVVQIDRNPGRGLHGTSPLRAAASLAWGMLSADELARSVLTGGIPATILKSKQRLEPAQALELQQAWVAATQRRGAAPAILDPLLDFVQTLSMSPDDLSLLESREFGARALAGLYGVPAILLNIPMTGGLNYQNPALLGEQWWRFELRTMAKRIEDAFSHQMLPRGNWVTVESSDTYAAITQEDDPQLAEEEAPPNGAAASPADERGTVTPIRAVGG